MALDKNRMSRSQQAQSLMAEKMSQMSAVSAHQEQLEVEYDPEKVVMSPEQIERLQEKIYYGKATRADITRVTKRLGDEIAAVYGFHIPKQRTAMEQAR